MNDFSTGHKLGMHVEFEQVDGILSRIAQARPRVIVAIDKPQFLQEAHSILGDSCLYLTRYADAGRKEFLVSDGVTYSPEVAARMAVDRQMPWLNQTPFAAVMGPNEIDVPKLLPQYDDYEAERQRILNERGFSASVGGFGVGSPAVSDADGDGREDQWPGFYSALAAAHQFKNYLALNEYGALWMDMWYGPNQDGEVLAGRRVALPSERLEGWLFGRYRKVWRRHIEPNRWTDVRIVLPEVGLDSAARATTDAIAGNSTDDWINCGNAWKRGVGNQPKVVDVALEYATQLWWLNRQIKLDPCVVGAAVFTWFNRPDDEWWNYNIAGRGPDEHLAAWMSQDRPQNAAVVNRSGWPGVNLRSGAGDALAVLKAGEFVRIVTQAGGSFLVETQDRIVGYCPLKYLTPLT